MPWDAVDNVPLLLAASTTTITSAKPEIILFLAKNCHGNGLVFIGYSLIIAPPEEIILSAKDLCIAGYTMSNPLANTAIVKPSLSNAPLCATESIPKAKPDITTIPTSANLLAILFAIFLP